MTTPHENPAFVGDDGRGVPSKNNVEVGRITSTDNAIPPKDKPMPERDTWGKGIEFLLSCIAMSVGLGNVWRFPFTALDNGGGAFLIPYLVVLFLVGKPIYYLEMIIGQFSSRGSVKVFDLCPAMRGVGIGQIVSISMVTTYYVAIMGMTVRYLFESFKSPLPWTECRDSWNAVCVASAEVNTAEILYSATDNLTSTTLPSIISNVSSVILNNVTSLSSVKPKSSAELYFINEVLREKQNINDGIGWPNWELVLGLFVSWLCVFGIISRGVKSSGKASYFLAIFPYVIMLVLLIRAVTLPGSIDGIIYFIKPDWSKILDPKVWYAAVTQCFYSLSVCFGNIIMYASYNKFGHNVHRDATIVTGLDTCTSLLAGFTIFGILGHLAHEIGTDDIGSVVKGGAGLAFISYPDAIAKFKQLPQIFSVLFFLMLFVLGIGSNIAMTSCTVTAIRDNFPQAKQWQCALGIAIVSFAIGLAYVTPGGQFILTLVDYFGASMIALVLGIAELYCLGWVYGVDRLCKDAEFMMGRKVGPYWRWCWAVVTPLIMTVILIYFLSTYTPLTYNGVNYPNWAYAIGWTITCFGVLQLPIWVVVAAIRTPGATWGEKLRGAFKPKHDWGPTDPLLREQYNKEIANEAIANEGLGCWGSIKKNIFG
ncbi:sodium-dependent nutrient amino acid transporter 1 isoform X1 [Lucilia sericata]|uniref:sodium-dependent nutrient amino acid transporter 1 isoform X1 n=1 Tax=Lucilia sericata TaxID=13632 RepID=UPI0018A82AC3|nr:sodium-dependent nutrient amino acid transporter 1 isoform X1 [Lucilia sericata]